MSPQSFGRGVMPDDFAAYRKQRFRWAYGAMQICRGHWRALLSPFGRELHASASAGISSPAGCPGSAMRWG